MERLSTIPCLLGGHCEKIGFMKQNKPKGYQHLEREAFWLKMWEEQRTYQWNSEATREQTFAIDTPPPTVSGSLHIGHVFSYTHTDIIARYQRMIGKSVFYPMGCDDNGLPTERRVQQVFGIRCQPDLPYDPTVTYSMDHGRKQRDFLPVSRQNFIEACKQLTVADERVFEQLWKQLGLSVDWQLRYETINDHCRELSQRSFLDCHQKGKVRHHEAPTMWDVDFQTAVAQAEAEDRKKPGAYHHICFKTVAGESCVIATTRPELLPACIALVAHPEDARYQALFGATAVTPLFHMTVPILPSRHADPEKGTGILMVCTFGDADDVAWWRESGLPIRQVIGKDGCFLPIDWTQHPFESTQPEVARSYSDQLVGLRAKKARDRLVAWLQEPQTGPALVAAPEEIEHPVKYYEKGDYPLEWIPTRQWFIDVLTDKEALLAQGEAIQWQPAYMKSRYVNWVEGLNQDWCISRQRFFGVPFPVWYPTDCAGTPCYDRPIIAEDARLPVDPLTDVPPGYRPEQRNQPHGFMGDPDVMDTWATSSLTPQIMSQWTKNAARHSAVFPMDIRPQSHEIIRTWAFYTIVKSWIHEQCIPWKNVVISGWVLDPDRKKMSKSKGNVVTPEHLFKHYSADAIRYWAANAKLGADTVCDEGVFKIGKKLLTKCFNAASFVLMQTADDEAYSTADVTEPMDHAWLKEVDDRIEEATACMNAFDFAGALAITERLFWSFCDDYIELVKVRAYRDDDRTKRRSARAGLLLTLSVVLRLLAPVFPFLTEDIWSWSFAQAGAFKSIHTESWPTPYRLQPAHPSLCRTTPVFKALGAIRAAKSQAKKNMKWPVQTVEISASEADLAGIKPAESDIRRAGSVTDMVYCVHPHETLAFTVQLAEEAPQPHA